MEQVLEIVIQALGVDKVMEICQQKKQPAPAPAPAPTSVAAPTPETKKPTVVVAPDAPIKVKVVKVHKVVKKPSETAESSVVKKLEPELSAVTEVPAPQEPASAPSEPAKVVIKKVAQKKAAEGPRCDGRIYGEKLEIPGSKAPNGGPLHCYKIAQCDRRGSETISLDDGESEAHLCKVCIKHYNSRTENPAHWHGLFDIDTAPETSHFFGGPWHKAVEAKVKKAEAAAESE